MRTLQYMFMAMAALLMATPAFAQAGSSAGPSWVPIGAGIGMAIASGLCGLGQGRAAGWPRKPLPAIREPAPPFSSSWCSAWPSWNPWLCSPSSSSS